MKLAAIVRLIFFTTTVGLFLLSPIGFAQDTQEMQALELIEQAADKLCQTVPTEQTSSGTELNAQAKAQVNGLIREQLLPTELAAASPSVVLPHLGASVYRTSCPLHPHCKTGWSLIPIQVLRRLILT